MDEQRKSVFRNRTMERISSPEQLDDYLRVTDPGIWVILAAVLLLLAGIFAWSMIGTLETRADATAIVENRTALVACESAQTLAEGMALRIGEQEYGIAATQTDDYGRILGVAQVELPDGTYEATVVTESVHPIRFLLESR